MLRYLTDCYKTLVQTVPVDQLSDDLDDVVEWLGAMIRRVDSSLIDEWERLRAPDADGAETPTVEPDDITANRRAFAVLVRNEIFAAVTALATRRLDLPGVEDYWDEHDHIEIDADARATRWVTLDLEGGRAEQILTDPEGHMEWRLEAEVDLDASRREDRAVVRPLRVVRL